jgi:endonuclease/exonuclease/phosphatase family metal-dependent hydrolase
MTPDNEILSPIFELMTDTAETYCHDKLSFPSDVPNRKIDYIFASRDVNVISADIPEIIASDHRPHIADVKC